ncbi:MAG: NAD-dependent epimerase/dehydratase family protein, partial [Actinomycetota bacterium]|nr:NAD-dependent epimerase/dehydratase family protein [Actinomycetota bacterium]
MKTAVVTGSGGLIGSQSVIKLVEAGWHVIGI